MCKDNVCLGVVEYKTTINRLAQEIIDTVSDDILKDVIFIGIHKQGVYIVEHLKKVLEELTSCSITVGTLDITMYRDDIGRRKTLPRIYETHIPFDLDGRLVILVDDVLETGRTIRAAMDALMDYGRPSCIQLVALVDRKALELPIRANYVGIVKEVSENEQIVVSCDTLDKDTIVYIEKRAKKEL
jgi:pyrimidine operon attenuation protein/uracil phosphoribosyltransferase